MFKPLELVALERAATVLSDSNYARLETRREKSGKSAEHQLLGGRAKSGKSAEHPRDPRVEDPGAAYWDGHLAALGPLAGAFALARLLHVLLALALFDELCPLLPLTPTAHL